MTKLSVEQLQDVMHAVRHYQYHHISINNPRYDEFSEILNMFVEQIHDANKAHKDQMMFQQASLQIKK